MDEILTLTGRSFFQAGAGGGFLVHGTPSEGGLSASSMMRIEEDAHPGRLAWNLQRTHLERNMLFQISMIMFHVHLPGCTFLLEKLKASRFLTAG